MQKWGSELTLSLDHVAAKNLVKNLQNSATWSCYKSGFTEEKKKSPTKSLAGSCVLQIPKQKSLVDPQLHAEGGVLLHILAWYQYEQCILSFVDSSALCLRSMHAHPPHRKTITYKNKPGQMLVQIYLEKLFFLWRE